MTPEQQGLIEDIATRFIAAAPESDWTELQIDVSMLNSISGFAATAIDAEGNETPFFIDDATDKKILHALGRMREDMATAAPGQGAWYIMSLRVPHDGKPYVDFDYFTQPEFGVHVGTGAFKQDLQAFPRSEENLPEWLGGKPRLKPVVKPVEATAPIAPTPQVASRPEPARPATPPIAPAGDFQLDDNGRPASQSSPSNEPMDEALLADETGNDTGGQVVSQPPLTQPPAPRPVPTITGAPNATPVPEPAPEPAPESPAAAEADDTPWYADPDEPNA